MVGVNTGVARALLHLYTLKVSMRMGHLRALLDVPDVFTFRYRALCGTAEGPTVGTHQRTEWW